MKWIEPAFRGKLGFLSNFHLCDIRDKDGVVWPSSEHAYQAMKFQSAMVRESVRKHPLTGLKKYCRTLAGFRQDWEQVRDKFMELIVRAKFKQHPDLMEKLKATSPMVLIETNGWHDNYWGSCFCPRCGSKGQNELGKLLMRIRKES